MPKKTAKKSTSSKASKKTPPQSASHDQLLREQLLFLLKGGGAHINFADAIAGWAYRLAGVKVAKFPHTAWMLLEHVRLAQFDILEFSRNPKHVSPKWPEGYWPASETPPDEKAWVASVAAFKKDMLAMENLISDRKADLYAPISWGDGQTLLREALLLADHNAYHLGQLVTLRKSIGI
jgi:hypothetical protein